MIAIQVSIKVLYGAFSFLSRPNTSRLKNGSYLQLSPDYLIFRFVYSLVPIRAIWGAHLSLTTIRLSRLQSSRGSNPSIQKNKAIPFTLHQAAFRRKEQSRCASDQRASTNLSIAQIAESELTPFWGSSPTNALSAERKSSQGTLLGDRPLCLLRRRARQCRPQLRELRRLLERQGRAISG